MYKLHLILKYLRKRRIAWVSLIAVMLCTAMVLVVISVMGGWLRMFRESFHGLTGDIVVRGESMTGFPYYEEIIRRAEKLSGVEAAVPTLHCYALINIDNQLRLGVEAVGYPIEKIGKVNAFPQSLYRQYEQYVDAGKKPPPPSFGLLPGVDYDALLPGARGTPPRQWPGMIVGIGVVGIKKNAKGELERLPNGGMYRAWAKLSVLGVDIDETTMKGKEPTERMYWLVDDSRTKIWQYDEKSVYVPFDLLQKDLRMDAADGQPARTTDVRIKVRNGHDLYQTRAEVEKIVNDVFREEGIEAGYPVIVQTWEQTNAKFLGAIEKEKVLVTLLFALISVVAIFLIFCIFYMIVVEKTKDIGIIKSVGATSSGVAGIFLGYGLAIGIVGGALGLLGAYLIVHNINELHHWLGVALHVQMWDPEVYAFDIIPNTMSQKETIVIVTVAVISSVLGALLPAIRAARMHPVEALRWE
jgi:lipoprotein-releasing system permease protein